MMIDRINKFEALPEQTVAEFNKIFYDNQITQGRLEAEVEIGEILGPANVRELIVDGVKTRHEFRIHTNAPALYEAFLLDVQGARSQGYPKDDYVKTSAPKVRRNMQEQQSNANLENLVLEDKEMKLEPIEYMLLQYFRGCQSVFHTQPEIASKISKSVRTIRDTLKRMEEKQILQTNVIPEIHKMAITVNEEWL